MARGPHFDLAAELERPSFTPAQRDAPALVELVIADAEPAATRAAAALGKLGAVARTAIEARGAVDDAAAMRLVAVLGQLARGGDAQARAAVLSRLGDPAVRVRRAAASALGKLGGDDALAALLARWDASDVTPDERRVLAEALGKLGGDDALARLRALDPGGDAELARRRDRAVLMAERDARRDQPAAIAIDRAPPSPLTVRLRCKPGLAPLLAEEARARGFSPTPRGDDAVDVPLAAPWSALFASRLWASASIRLPRAPDLARAIASPAVRALLAAWTIGPIRWRLALPHGHQRSLVWRTAQEVAQLAPELINDPTETAWDIIPLEDALELVPRRAADPRFAWRVAEIPAASHPSVAAALAFVAGARSGDRVWDPFVGSAAELVERARLGPFAALAGSDLDDRALAAARENLAAAGVTAELALADARTHARGAIDLVITNPPLGSRVQLDAAGLLVAALPNLARSLAPGGRLVWITPAPRKTSPVAERLGLVRARALAVDLGGVRGQLERWDRKG